LRHDDLVDLAAADQHQRAFGSATSGVAEVRSEE
jgi:hypothetical protein